MRFNPHAFKRLTEQPPVSATDPAIAATSAAPLPESVVPSSVVSLSPALAAFIAAYCRDHDVTNADLVAIRTASNPCPDVHFLSNA